MLSIVLLDSRNKMNLHQINISQQTLYDPLENSKLIINKLWRNDGRRVRLIVLFPVLLWIPFIERVNIDVFNTFIWLLQEAVKLRSSDQTDVVWQLPMLIHKPKSLLLSFGLLVQNSLVLQNDLIQHWMMNKRSFKHQGEGKVVFIDLLVLLILVFLGGWGVCSRGLTYILQV